MLAPTAQLPIGEQVLVRPLPHREVFSCVDEWVCCVCAGRTTASPSVNVWMCGWVCVRAPVDHTYERVGGCARGSHSDLGRLIEVGRHERRQADGRGWLRRRQL